MMLRCCRFHGARLESISGVRCVQDRWNEKERARVFSSALAHVGGGGPVLFATAGNARLAAFLRAPSDAIAVVVWDQRLLSPDDQR